MKMLRNVTILFLCLWTEGLFPADRKEPAGCSVETLNYAVRDPKTAEEKSRVTIEVHRQGRDYHWLETRRHSGGKTVVFDVRFTMPGMRIRQYRRLTVSGPDTAEVRLKTGRKTVSAVIRKPDGETVRESIPLPKGPYVVEPFMKYYLAHENAQGRQAGQVRFIGWVDDAFKCFSIRWESGANRQIRVPAGVFSALEVRVTAASWFARLLNISAVLWVDTRNTPKVLKAPVRKGLFGEEYTMELESSVLKECGNAK